MMAISTPAVVANPSSDGSMLIGVDEVASRLGLSKRSVWRFVERGILPRPVRLGDTTRWSVRGLAQWVEAGCPAPNPREGLKRPV
jgi:predicted DNA-binding transcriptional regulator AlpA